jgi:Ca-activated chloride channel family protein
MMAVRVIVVMSLLAVLAVGSWRNPYFWSLPDRRGDRLMHAQLYKEAAEAYEDPWRTGIAQYRNGDFKEAAATFARVPGANGAFDQGNALLMHGAYDDAIASYDRALGFRPGWREAEENKALAAARKKRIDDAGADREQESAGAYDPDETVVDPNGEERNTEPQDMNGEVLSDEELRATWLRRVQTTPGDFLRAKFAYQAARPETAADGEPAP